MQHSIKINHLIGRLRQRLVNHSDSLHTPLSFKKRALPCFPNGFAKFGDASACCGLSDGKGLLLAVWNTGGKGGVRVKLPAWKGADVKVLYPKTLPTEVLREGDTLLVKLPEGYSARLLGLGFGS